MSSKEERGYQARQLLDHDITQEVLDGLEKTYLDAWRVAKTPEAREDCHRYITIIGRFKADLASIALTGDIELEDKRRRELQGKRTLPWMT